MNNIISGKYKPQMEANEEIRLIKKAVGGSHQEFIQLITLYKTYLYRTAYAYVKDEHKAKDILQECTYKAFLNIKKLKNPDFFKTWITKILINEAVALLKKDSRLEELGDNSVLICPTDGSTIEEKVDLYNAIDMLKPSYKTVIILRYFNDLSLENIASIMDIPENTVKTYLRRAKQSLADILKEDYLYG